MKKISCITLVALLIISMFTACASGNPSAPQQTPGATESDDTTQPVELPTLELWHYHTTAMEEAINNKVAEYNALPERKANVNVQYIPREELSKRYALGVASGDLPQIAVIDNPESASYASMGMFLDITDKVATLPNPNFLEGPINSGNYQGKQYTMPIRSNCLALWSNDEMLAAAGVTKIPQTWDELLAACETLQKTNPKVYPLSYCALKSEEGTFHLLPFLLSAGASWDSMDTPEAVNALTMLKTLFDKKYVSPEVINWTQNDMEKQFAAGNTAMMINGSWHIANMAKDAPDLKYTINNIPKDKVYASVLGGENLGITIAAKDEFDAAWDFFSWFISLDANITYNTSS
ncbi:MAG: ABC transporter substrate-binding protein, partial [Acetanaerobacterium sp.]